MLAPKTSGSMLLGKGGVVGFAGLPAGVRDRMGVVSWLRREIWRGVNMDFIITRPSEWRAWAISGVGVVRCLVEKWDDVAPAAVAVVVLWRRANIRFFVVSLLLSWWRDL